MATLYISEYATLPTAGGAVQIAAEPAVATQAVSFSTTTQSAAFAADTKFVRLHTDAICSIAFGKNPTATTAGARMAADHTEYFGVVAGHKVAAVSNT